MKPEIIAEHGLTIDEYQRIVEVMGREPNLVELGIFSVMWSEHCSYKSSRDLLRKLPTSGPQVIEGPGENAGVIRFTDELALVFKMESHNHPSFIEPYQGAATGVGGILRDIFTMGARPIANMNALRFGDPAHSKTRHLVRGVVAGIGGYGNCIGVPTVGGETAFAPCFNGNNLVNAMTVGIVRQDAIFRGRAEGKGNPVFYVGSKTGRDGIHGATMASESFGDGNEDRRPTVQVGDPFLEKLLLEACLEAMQTGAILGIQDMGAAGLTSSSFEMAARAGSGIDLNLDLVPRREEGMTAYELMLSESQERMLMVLQQGKETVVQEIFAKWGLDCCKVGEVTDTARYQARMNGEMVVDIPVSPVVNEAPIYHRPQKRPLEQTSINALDLATIEDVDDANMVLLRLLRSPNGSCRRWIYEQYDQQVGTDTVVLPGSDAAVLRVKGTKRGIALAVDCNSRYCYLDPYWGAAHAVAEAARNVSCSGAVPQAITDCLNFGSPENPEVMWQFAQALRGMGEACQQLNTPVVGGNVSFYNETDGAAIWPTPMVGMVGILDDVSRHARQFFQNDGDRIVLLVGTDTGPKENSAGELSNAVRGSLGGSEYLATIHGQIRGIPPELNWHRELAVQHFVVSAISRGLVCNAHDCSDGGLAVALAESAISGAARLGVKVDLRQFSAGRVDELLFGETPARILLGVPAESIAALYNLAQGASVELVDIGVVGGSRFQIKGLINLALDELYREWSCGFETEVLRCCQK